MEKVLLYLNNYLNEGDIIVVATSGGPDSMCLLHLLCELKRKLRLTLIVAHVNHNLRIESKEEAQFVKRICQEHNLIYEYMEILKYNDDNLENDARLKRYAFFSQLVSKYQAKYLMTAHHGDDLIETILMRLTRGSSLKGYSGFKKEYFTGSYTIVRPLITETKKDIETFMQEHNLKYFVDQSNFSDTYTRNRYRQNILPFLKKENAQVHRKYLKFSEELDAANKFIDKQVTKIIDQISTPQGLNIEKLLKQEDFLIRRVIEYNLNAIYVDDLFLISDKHTKAIINMLKSRKSNSQINLPNNYRAIKSYNYYKIVKINKDEFYEYILGEKQVLPNKMIIKKIKDNNCKSNYVIRLNSKDIALPIKIRSRLNGDRIAIKNLGGTKKVKDIFIDEKIPRDLRNSIPVVTDSNNTILWLPGIKKSKFDVETNEIYDIILSYEEE